MLRRTVLSALAMFLVLPMMAETPAVGTAAPNFTLNTPDGKSIALNGMTSKGTTALVFLRGYPGYQCPYCVKQVHDYIEHADKLAAAHVTVLFVYPGPPADLDAHAREALAKQAALPANIILVTDPDYSATNQYSLRWDAPHETAYPSTFLLKRGGIVTWEKVSHGHGDRTTADEVLAQVHP